MDTVESGAELVFGDLAVVVFRRLAARDSLTASASDLITTLEATA